MPSVERLRADLGAAVAEVGGGLSAADRLCLACVELLDIDGAAISVIHGGATRGTFGSSGELSKRLDEFQFTFGEGPCLDAVLQGRPVLVEDIGHSEESRWPAFAGAVLDAGVRAVFGCRWRSPPRRWGHWTCSAACLALSATTLWLVG